MKKITAAFAFVASVFASGSALGAVQFIDYTGALASNTIVLKFSDDYVKFASCGCMV